MREHKCKALIPDSDPDTLIALQRTFENGSVDTTITWDNGKARNLIRSMQFDVMLIGDPPEISAENTVRNFRVHGASGPCLILRTIAQEMTAERLQRLGVVAVLPKRDPGKIFEEVQGSCGLKTAS